MLLDKEMKILKLLNNYRVEIGVISSDTSREEEKISVGITNAELMQMHENGSPTKNIPSRPVLDMTIKWCEKTLMLKTLDKIIGGVINSGWNISEIERELNKMCVRMQNYAQELIYDNDGRLAPNSEITAKIKADKARKLGKEPAGNPPGNHPLFDTGQLARSITCRLVNKNFQK